MSEASAAGMAARSHGELVDRLMARIGELEAKLYDKELADANFTIPAVHGTPAQPSPRTTAAANQLAAGVNLQLLDSLGDPDKHPPTQQTPAGSWRAAASSWLAASPLARSALGSLTATTQLDGLTDAHAASAAAADRPQSGAAPYSLNTTGSAASKGGGPSTDVDGSVAKATTTATATAARSLRTSSDALPAAPSTSTPSFSFQQQPKQQPNRSASPNTGPAPGAAGAGLASEGSFSSQHTKGDVSGKGGWGGLRSYYRYIMPQAQDEEDCYQGLSDSDVQKVQEAAGIALAEANERLLQAELRVQAAQAAQRQLQQQLDAAEQLQQDVEQLKTENLEAWRQKYELEGQLATARANMQGLQAQAGSMHKELEDLRMQAQIWCDSHHSEGDKLKAEVELLNGQLLQRSNEVSSVREQLTEARAERDRALQEKQQALEERDRLQQQLQSVSSLQQQLATATAAAAESAASAAEFQEKFIRERAIRRRLHEQLQVLRGNIRVMCRVRPAQKQQPQQGPGSNSSNSSNNSSSSCITVPLEGLLCVNDVMTARTREFEFDAVFGPDATQQQVFEEVSPMVRSCADGYNVCIFAYGQTGSGKTFTMEGPPSNPGINSRALQELFKIAAEEGEAPSPWVFSVSMMEIYIDAVRDLLALAAASSGRGSGSGNSSAASSNSSSPSNSPPGAHAALSSSLDVSGLPAGELPAHMDRVPGLVWRDVSCAEDVAAVLKEGWRARATAATALNAASSRSHALLCVKVRGVREGRPFTSLLYLVDLAGSERVDKSEVTGQQLKEAQAINKSLSALGDVISALQHRSPHIPFRNSKLTQVLQDSLCGSSKVLLVCNLSPEAASCADTLSSLNFASRAAQVELGQARRVTAGAPAAGGSGGMASSPAAASSSSSFEAALMAEAGSSVVRAKSPVVAAGLGPNGARSNGGSGGGGGGAVAAATAAAGAAGGVRPVSRLSDRAGVGTAGSSGGVGGSPRVSMAKPARH